MAASVVCAMTAPFAHLALRRGVSVYATKEHSCRPRLSSVPLLSAPALRIVKILQCNAWAASTSRRKGSVYKHAQGRRPHARFLD